MSSALYLHFKTGSVINRIHHASPEVLRKWKRELDKGGSTPIYDRLLAETPSGLDLLAPLGFRDPDKVLPTGDFDGDEDGTPNAW